MSTQKSEILNISDATTAPAPKRRGRPPKQKTADSPESAAQNAVTTKRKRNRPDLENFGAERVEPGDNARFLRQALVAFDLPPIDISDPKQVEQRIHDYFDFCVENDKKPNIIGMGNWLGVARDTINQWKNGDCRSSTHTAIIKKALVLMEEIWVDYMMNGKVNPGSGIFIGKNHFGYKDVQDVVITPNNPLGEETDPNAIASKYKELPED